jgi:hypothetical protein
MNQDFRKALAQLSLNDIELDDDGRLIISNADLAREIADAAKLSPARMSADTNYGCCENLAVCGKAKADSLEGRMVRPAGK